MIRRMCAAVLAVEGLVFVYVSVASRPLEVGDDAAGMFAVFLMGLAIALVLDGKGDG